MLGLGLSIPRCAVRAGDALTREIASILAKYGTDAHVYLPGIGVINGLTAGNYLDSAGTTPSTVDNPVGLVLDAANSQLGSELVSNGTFTTDTTGWATTAGSLTVESAKGKLQNSGAVSALSSIPITTVVGKTYKATVECQNISALGANRLYVGTTAGAFNLLSLSTANGDLTLQTLTGYFVATGTTSYVAISNRAITDAISYYDNVSVKEVTGIHATQSTTAHKPILRYVSGRYYFDFVDGTDVLNATYPAGWESATIINTAETGQVTYTAQNIVGNYDIRGAVIGSELAENGTFDTDTLWTKGTGWTISGGTANFSGASGSSLSQSETLVAGKSYLIVFDLSGSSISCSVSFSGGGADSVAAFTTAGRKYAFITCTANRTAFNFNTVGSSNLSIDNVSVREATLKEYARFIFRTGLTASELAIVQSYCNRLAGV